MTLKIRTTLGAAMLVPVVAVLAACGGSASTSAQSKSSAVTAKTTVAASKQSKASAAATSKSPTAPTYRQLTSDQLVKTLLTLDEIPAGYTAEKPDLTDSNVTFCHYKQPNRETGYAAITFEQPPTKVIGHTIRQYKSVADATAQQAALSKAVEAGCTMTDSGATLKVAQMSAPKLGDSSVGVALNSDSTTINEIFVQVGPTVFAVANARVGAGDVTGLTALAKKAIAKYKSSALQG